MINNFHFDASDLLRCPICEAVNKDSRGDVYCRRCHAKIFTHSSISVSRSWAFLITALILYIPANIYPILVTEQLFSRTESTIIGGIVSLWETGSYPVALIILAASVLVPILKFIVLIYLLSASKTKYRKDSSYRYHRLHHITEIIGPWSMIDIFVVAVLTGLVHMDSIKVVAGTGTTAFVLMVIFTMLSALSFDIRLFKGDKR